MENRFTQVMSERTDEELIKIVSIDRKQYQPKAIEAAELEIEKRKIDANKIEQMKKETAAEKLKYEEVNSNTVGVGTRFLNFIIDLFVWFILVTIISLIINPFIQTTDQLALQIVTYILFFGTYVAYYSIMEIKFQKTVGKFLTKTKVVKMNGEKAENIDIIARSFYRLIPFDRLSFLFVKNGIHDFLSKTNVVMDKVD